MPALRELQMSFEQLAAGKAPDDLLKLVTGRGSDPAALLAIYRNNVVTRLTDTLSVAFPVVCKLVDRGFFDYAAHAFLRQHLPVSGCLGEYGGNFPHFLAGFEPAIELGYLADVARLEWAIHEIRTAAALPHIAVAALAAKPGDPSLFRLQVSPAVRFIASPYPIDQIWIAHQEDAEWDELRMRGHPARLQIDGASGLRILNLPPAIWELRARLAAHETLESAIAAALAVSPAFDPPSALAALFSDQLVVGLT